MSQTVNFISIQIEFKRYSSSFLDHINDGLHFFWSVLVAVWILLVLVADINISVQTLQGGQRGDGEYFHEDVGQQEAHQADNSQWGDWVFDFSLKFREEPQDEEGNEHVCNDDACLSKEMDQASDSIGHEEATRVLESKDEGRHS